MPKYIEREAMWKEYLKFPVHFTSHGAGAVVDAYRVQEAIKTLPAADVVEVKHGEWKEVNQIGKNSRHIRYTTKQCSVCGYWNGRRKTNYCPNCGAKMDLKEGAEE